MHDEHSEKIVVFVGSLRILEFYIRRITNFLSTKKHFSSPLKVHNLFPMADVSSDFESLKRDVGLVSLFSVEVVKDLISRLIGLLLHPAKSNLFQEYLAELAEKNR